MFLPVTFSFLFFPVASGAREFGDDNVRGKCQNKTNFPRREIKRGDKGISPI